MSYPSGPSFTNPSITNQPGVYQPGGYQPGGYQPAQSNAPPGAPTQWMPLPPSMPNCPPGLEYLTQIDQFVVVQHVSLTEMFTGWEVANKYAIYNGVGQQVFLALEESGTAERQVLGSSRGYAMHIVDNYQREVMVMRRPYKFLLPIPTNDNRFDSECTVEAPPGQIIGKVREGGSCLRRNFVVRDASDSMDLLRLDTPNSGQCLQFFCDDKIYEIYAMNGVQPIGAFRKRWNGVMAQDVFIVEFPLDLDVRVKAALLGATFLIDFLRFEQQPQAFNNGPSATVSV